MTGTFPALKQIGGHHTLEDVGIGGAAAAALALPFLLPELGAGLGAGGAAAGATDLAAGAPLDLLAGGEAAGTAIPAAVGDIVAPTGALASGLATEPGLASGALGSFAPGLDTSASALGAAVAPVGASPTTGGAGAGAGGASAAGAAAPAGANGIVSSDFGALAGAPTTSSSGQPLSLLAGDPSAVVGTGTTGGFDLGTLGQGVSASGGPLGDAAPISLAPAVAATTAAGGSGLSGLLGQAGSWVANNPLMAAALGLGGGEMLYNALKPAKLPYQQQQEQIATQAQENAAQNAALGNQYLQYQTSGTLPPGLQAQVAQALSDAQAASNSKYASLGLGNSTMAQQEQQYLTLQSQALAGQLQQQLAQTGTQLISDATSDLSVAGNIYSSLMQSQISQDNALEQSVVSFASALALASAGKIKIPTGTTTTVAA